MWLALTNVNPAPCIHLRDTWAPAVPVRTGSEVLENSGPGDWGATVGELLSAMAESQLVCMDDEHVNEKIPESRPEFYYSEEQRAALEQLLRNGDGAYKLRLKEDSTKDFLSDREVKFIRKTFHEYDTDSDSESGEHEKSKESSSADSGVHSTYWPQMSDTEVPSLDIGWPGSSGIYKGVTRVSVYTHPPKEHGPHIKEVVRKLIQESHKVSSAR